MGTTKQILKRVIKGFFCAIDLNLKNVFIEYHINICTLFSAMLFDALMLKLLIDNIYLNRYTNNIYDE